MKTLQQVLEASIEEVLSERDSPEELHALEVGMSSLIPEVANDTTESILRAIRKNARAGLKSNRKQRRQFEKRLERHWRKPLDLLDLFVSIATEAGDEFHKTCRDDPERPNETVHEALVHLHARACQVASAILALLRSGYADDAHARWRALHEIAVISIFISKQGEDTAERYLLHDGIQRYKLALKYIKHADALGLEPLPEGDLEKHSAVRNRLANRYGRAFKENYGWAASALGSEKPTFESIEERVRLGHWRPYYGMASDNIHANAHGGYYRLGSSPRAKKVFLAGPSIYGLANPGDSTAISLCQVTLAFIGTYPLLDNLVVSKILIALRDEVGEAFLEAHEDLEGPEHDNDNATDVI